LLIATGGAEIDPSLLHYASMVTTILGLCPARSDERAATHAPAAAPGVRNMPSRPQTPPATPSLRRWTSDAEVRLVALHSKSPPMRATSSLRTVRLALRAHVERHFQHLHSAAVVGCDVIRGALPGRLLSYLADFDADLLVLGREGMTAGALSRVVMASPAAVWTVPTNCAPILRRILVPIDFDRPAVQSLGAAVQLARRCSTAKCVVLHVDRQETLCGSDEIAPARLARLRAAFNVIMQTVDARGVRITPLFVKSQFVEQTIARTAHGLSADLVVMSTRRRGRLTAEIHSSIAAAAVPEAAAPVLILKLKGTPLRWRDALRCRLRNADSPYFS
jgi:nucleotide-binding universal stress UspA family protein